MRDKERGEMKRPVRTSVFLVGLIIGPGFLTACGGGGGGSPVAVLPEPTNPVDPVDPPVIPTGLSLPLPSGHGLAAGEIRVPPGVSAEHGNVELSCPAGGPACAVIVAADGTASYDRTGGIPTLKARRLPIPFLACAGATCPLYSSTRLPMQTGFDALQMPVYHTESSASTPQKLFVGVNQSGSAPTKVGEREGFDIRYGTVNDGNGEALVAEYLRQTQVDETFVGAFGQPDPDVAVPEIGDIVRYGVRPVVFYGGSPGARDVDRLVRAVQLVNAALPQDWKLNIPIDAPIDCAKCRNKGFTTRADWKLDLPQGFPDPESFIYVEFVPDSEWYRHELDAPANADMWSLNWDKTSVQYNVGHYSDASDRFAIAVLAHELLHVLGVRGSDRLKGHVDPSLESLLSSDGGYSTYNTLGHRLSVLSALDREALRVRYGRLGYQEPLTDFGPWASTSLHLSGHGPHVSFGVAWRNSYGEPWAHGYLPETDLNDNPVLQGTAIWAGALLGFTSAGEPVAGDARIAVGLAQLTGRADFTNMEQWGIGELPGNSGLGARWGDGSLTYSVVVTGNTFKRTGGDAGVLTGAFFGKSHEGVGGTLERDDLTAAFGGSR